MCTCMKPTKKTIRNPKPRWFHNSCHSNAYTSPKPNRPRPTLAISPKTFLSTPPKTLSFASSNLFLTLISPKKLPIILDFHGGGFILFSVASQVVHESYIRISNHVPALILAVEYRLAPENRLPAAYEDALDAIFWLKNQASEVNGSDEWSKESADFGTCVKRKYIVYHAGLRALDVDCSPDIKSAMVGSKGQDQS
ncbi:Alpha/beta hydrolase fold-3 [Dillenia turbinata]|uniref:Alpha/beta hydrolase fold-3 n=1 Tax=Dillenia turbinata TaxID=194707 RepID=A0AAN8UST1_9MAGN